MSEAEKVGISDIAIYLPRLKIDLNKIVHARALGTNSPKLEKILTRTLEKTGLKTMHFPTNWEDSVTMATQAAYQLLKRHQDKLPGLRYLVSGTETAIDHSKPIAAHVIGNLVKAGLKIPQSLSTFQTQHACAGGMVALMGISALLGYTGRSDESGVVVCSDVARYDKDSSAELTQGAGAVAIALETDPKLVELDIKTVGYSSKDVDDFFRPLESETAKVKGSFSIRCYMEAMESALLDHASRAGRNPEDILRSADMFALHVPYPKLPTDTMKTLVEKYLGYTGDDNCAFLEQKGFSAMTYPASRSGNIYTGSIFMSLAFLLKERYAKLGDAIVGKTVLFGSYGSGNTMVFLSGKISESAPEIIKEWDLESLWQQDEAQIDDYENWIAKNRVLEPSLKPETFYLSAIREDGYREYQFNQ